ncbi:MAG: hypothetical protein Alpg2KO_16520 [Alphaproteobacteria bacterium]
MNLTGLSSSATMPFIKLGIAIMLCFVAIALPGGVAYAQSSQSGTASLTAAVTVQPDGEVIVRQTITGYSNQAGRAGVVKHTPDGITRPVEVTSMVLNGQSLLPSADGLNDISFPTDDLGQTSFSLRRSLPDQSPVSIQSTTVMKRPFHLSGTRWELALPLALPPGMSISRAEVLVTLPRADREAVLTLAVNDNPGEFGPSAQSIPGRDDQLRIVWPYSLDEESHLVLQLSGRDTLISPPTAMDMVLANKGLQQAILTVGGVFLLQILAFLLMRLRSASRPAEPQPVPPNDISPAAARFVRDRGEAGVETFAAALASLEDHGMIELVQAGPKSTSYAVVQGKRHELPRDASAEERQLFKQLEPHLADQRDVMALSNDMNTMAMTTPVFGIGQKGGGLQERKIWRDAARRVNSSLQERYGESLFIKRKIWLLPALLLGLGSYGYHLMNLQGEAIFIGLFMTVWLSGWTAGTFTLLKQVFSAWKFAFSGGIGAFILGVIGASFLTAFATPFVGGWIMGATMLTAAAGITATTILLFTIISHMIFRKRMVGLNEQGAEMLAKIRGWDQTFEQFPPAGDDSMPGMPTMAGASRQPAWSIALGHKPGPRWKTIRARLASYVNSTKKPKPKAARSE